MIAAIAGAGIAVIATAIVFAAGAGPADATTSPVVATPRPARAQPVMQVERVEAAPPAAGVPEPLAPAKTVKKKPGSKRAAPKAAPRQWDPNALFPD